MSLKEQIVESVKWLFVAQVLSQLVRIAVTIFVLRNLASEEMAYVALSQSITSFLEIFSTLGLNAAIISKHGLVRRDLQNIFGLVVLINAALMLILVGGSEHFARFYDIPPLAAILQISSLSFLLITLRFIPNAVMVRDMRFKELSCIQLVAGIAGAATSLISILNGAGYWAVIYGGLAFQAVSTLLQLMASRLVMMPRFAIAESRQYISFGVYVVGGTMAWYALVTADLVIAGKFWSPEVLGIYALAVQVTAMPLNRILPLLKSVALPAFSKTYAQDSSKLRSYVIKSSRLAAFMSIPLFWGLAATTLLVVPLILGEKWLPAVLPLSFLCIAAPFRFFIELLTPAVMAKGNPKKIFHNSLFMAAVMTTAYAVVASQFTSPTLLAAVWMVLYPMLVLHAMTRYCRELDLKPHEIMRPLLPIIIGGVAMVIVAAGSILALDGRMHPWLLLISSAAAGALAYLGVIYLADRSLLAELATVARKGKREAP